MASGAGSAEAAARLQPLGFGVAAPGAAGVPPGGPVPPEWLERVDGHRGSHPEGWEEGDHGGHVGPT
jgi:hypothetical protein